MEAQPALHSMTAQLSAEQPSRSLGISNTGVHQQAMYTPPSQLTTDYQHVQSESAYKMSEQTFGLDYYSKHASTMSQQTQVYYQQPY